MVDERARSEETQSRVVEVLRRGPATPASVIQDVVESDDRTYSSDRVRGAINTLINRREVVIDGGQVKLSQT